MSFPARFTGWCRVCRTRVEVGEWIEWDEAGATHATCVPREERPTPVCQACRQATAANGRCGCDE